MNEEQKDRLRKSRDELASKLEKVPHEVFEVYVYLSRYVGPAKGAYGVGVARRGYNLAVEKWGKEAVDAATEL